MKYTSNELLEMDPIEVYKLVLSRKTPNFPKGFFTEPKSSSDDKYARIIRYLIEEVLKWDEKDLCKKYTRNILVKYRLTGMLHNVFYNSLYSVINHAYPNKYKPWQLSSTFYNYWNEKTAKEAIIWLIEEKLKWTDYEICNKLNYKVFKENGLGGMFSTIFNNSTYNTINSTYPNRFKPWEFSTVPHNYWNEETAKESIIWLLEEKLKWTDEDIRKNLSRKIFRENGLGGMFSMFFNNSTYAAINCVYPDRFKPWELKQAPKGFWNEETAKEASKWLFEEKLKWTDEEICEKLTPNVFKENGLGGMLYNFLGGNLYNVLNNAYPGKFEKVGKSIKLAD